ncbi:MAG TPA: sigma-70 family RNA polymerase sigma factor [Planctomycetota bacterium]|nr:sigma-70 family RNA polymerase sigma factor [Planctomycetota bacterium]
MIASNPEEISDAELVLHARTAARRADREEAFRLLVRRYWRTSLLLARSRLGSAHEAEDVTQEAFVRAWRSLENLKDPAHFLGWFLRIARNLAVDRVRRRRGEVSIENVSEAVVEASLRSPYARAPEGPEHRLELEEDWTAVEKALGALPDRYRTVITLRYMQDMPHGEIARALGEPEGTIRNRVFRALELLRGAIRPHTTLRHQESQPRS